MKKSKKFLAVLLSISLLFSGGCKADVNNKSENNNNSDIKTSDIAGKVSNIIDNYSTDAYYNCTDLINDDYFYSIDSIKYTDNKLYISGFVISDNNDFSELIIRNSSGDTLYRYNLEKNEQFYCTNGEIYTFKYNEDMITYITVIDTKTNSSEVTDISPYEISDISSVVISDNSILLLDKNSNIHIFGDNFSDYIKSDVSEYLLNSYKIYADNQKNVYIFTANDNETVLYKFDNTLNLIYRNDNYPDMPGGVYDIFVENDEFNISTMSDGFIYTNVIDTSNGETLLRKDIYQYSFQTDNSPENESCIQTCSDGKVVVLKYPDIEEYYCTVVKDENDNIIEERKLTTDKNNIISVIENCENGDTLYIEETYDRREVSDETDHIIHRLTADGACSSVTLPSYNNEKYPLALKTDSHKNLYVLENNENCYRIYCCNEQGELVYEKEYSSDILSFSDIILINDELYISYMSYDEKYVVQKINSDGELKEKEESELFLKIYAGNDKFDIFTSDGNKIYGYIFGTNEFSEILSLVNCGLQYAPSDFFEFKDSFVLKSGNSYYLLSYDEVSSSKQTVKLSGIGLSDIIKRQVINFNNKNDKYTIECVDYSQDEDSFKRLNMDIISRKTDMVVFGNRYPLKAENYNSFLFADLSEYMSGDTELSEDDYFSGVIDLFRSGNKLYTMGTEFNIYTMISRKENDNIFSPIDLNEFLDENRKMSEHRFGLASNILSSYIKNRDFADDNFRSVLKYLKENVYDIDSGNKSNFAFCEIPEDNRTSIYGCIMTPYFYQSDPEVSYFGFPSVSGNGIVVELTESFSILDNSKNKDGAWEFIKYCLSDEYQNELYRAIPVKRTAFEKSFDGEKAEKERCLTVIESADCKYIGNTALFDIIWEECNLYFNDMMSLDETIDSIKKKTSIYFSETDPVIF